jgi:hypothetical protein
MLNVNTVFSNVVTTQHTSAHTTKFYSVQHAKAQNIANAHLYSAQQLAFANAVLAQASSAFLRSTCYLNLRKRYISVKVSNVTKACLVSNAVAQFAQFCKQNNIAVKQTQNALVFNISFS